MPIDPLAPDLLYRACDPSRFRFETTAELDDFKGPLGQDRAVKAVSFGARIAQPGFNLFVHGPTGAGKHTSVREFLEAEAKANKAASDWVYVNNFATPHKPIALRLDPGDGSRLRDAMKQVVDDLKVAIRSVFEGEEYQNRRGAIDDEFQERQEQAFEQLGDKAEKNGVRVIRTPQGFAFAPVQQGEIIKPEVFRRLPEAQRTAIEATIEDLQKDLKAILEQIPRWEKERRDKVRELHKELANYSVGFLIDDVRNAFHDVPQVLDYLDAVRKDLIDHIDIFLLSSEAAEGGGNPLASALLASQTQGGDPFARYEVNLLVDNGPFRESGAPVVSEANPTLGNLVGRIEHIAQFGALTTDFTLIKPGALHRANGGYLLIDARKVLMQPFTWEALKRALSDARITIENPAEFYGLATTVSLEPDPIPLDVKVVMFGDRMLYYMLCQLDPEFEDLFKVAADFDEAMDREEESEQAYARLVAEIARREKLKPLDRTGVARVIEQASRLSEDAEKVSIMVGPLADLLREADYWAGEQKAEVISADHIQQAIDAQTARADRIRERVQEAITREIVLIDTEGSKAGQINGLSVMSVGSFAFGRPSRISARVRMGPGGGARLLDIEREVELGGPLHSKGVLILSGYLMSHFCPESPISLSASLVFEQSYGGVDGDSASSAELYALLSAISETPLNQGLAVTGAVNQHGEVEAIGGVNEKIEGFFDICNARGLTGKQGVLIPASNVKHLMLRSDVVEAVRDKKFAIYPVSTIDEGIELLTGMPAGTRGDDGTFREGTLNRRVEDRLLNFVELQKKFAEEMKAAAGGNGGEGAPGS